MFSIAIPSHHRSATIGTNTLRMLDAHAVPHSMIKVFVAPEEIPLYRSAIPADIEIIEGRLGCIENRAAIRDHFPADHNIVYMDDDLKGLYSVCDISSHLNCHCYNKKNAGAISYTKQIPLPDFFKFITDAFQTMRTEGAHLGGIYPVCNGYFATHRYTTGLRYVCGFMYLEINQKDFQLRGDQYAEDFERSCAFYARDGTVVRFEYVMAKTSFYSGKGGLVESRTVDRSRSATEKLAAMYPDYLTVKPPTPSNKYWNLRLKRVPSATSRSHSTASVVLGPPQHIPHDDQQ